MADPYDSEKEYQGRSRRTSAVDRMRQGNRRPSFAFGKNGPILRGFRSVPGATPSPRDLDEFGQPIVRGLKTADFGTGMTDSGAWDRFFHKRDFARPMPGQTAAPASPSSNAFSTAGGFFPSLAPTTPPDAAGMASAMNRPYTTPRVSADSLYRQAANSHMRAMGGGDILPSGAQVTFKKGPFMKISTPYGTGSVRPLGAAQADPTSSLYVPKHERQWQDLMDEV